MQISLIFPVLPPVINGIGDYTAQLAAELAKSCSVEVFTGQDNFDIISGVKITGVFERNHHRTMENVWRELTHRPPDWLVLQYNPFSYGRWGFNMQLPALMSRLKRQRSSLKLAVMVHEPFVPVESMKLLVMSTWQRWQFMKICRSADLLFFSISPWVARFKKWFPEHPVVHLPVGSNIPNVRASEHQARNRFGIEPESLVLGLFGTAHPSRLLNFVKSAVEAAARERPNVTCVYVGPHGQQIRQSLAPLPVLDVGALPPDDVSCCFSAFDIYLAPFRGGVSSRRGSFMVGLQHGIATVGTVGIHTDSDLAEQDGSAFVLTPDDDEEGFRNEVSAICREPMRRKQLASQGQEFFDSRFSWEIIARKMRESMHAVDPVSV